MGGKQGSTLFRVAAIFNLLVGLPTLFAFPALTSLIGTPEPRSVWTDLVGAAVTLFGWIYWRIAVDPVGCRPYALLGVVGKLAFVVVVYANFAFGGAPVGLAALVTVDLVFAVLFARWLRDTAPGRGSQR